MRYLILLLICLATFACEGDTKNRRAAKGEHFVPDPNHLFFLNTRAGDYSQDNRNDAGNYYTHDDLYASKATLLPVIYDDWVNDRAYLELRARATGGPASPTGEMQLIITSPTGDNEVTLPPRLSRDNAEQLRHHLATNRKINWVAAQDTLEAFPGKARDHAATVLKDYLSLVQRK